VIAGTYSSGETETCAKFDLWNDIFDLSISGGASASGSGTSCGTEPFYKQATPFSAFASAPENLPWLSAVAWMNGNSLPASAQAIYSTGNCVGVAAIPFGSGFVVLLGWDGYRYSQDSTLTRPWDIVLWSAIQIRATAPFPALPAPSVAMTAKLTRIGNTTSVESKQENLGS
jgi:hypothetical protein